MTELRQLAAASLDVARTHVIEHQRSIVQVPPRQAVLDRSLRHAQPVECSVDFLGFDLTQSKCQPEGIESRRLVQRARRGKLCRRIDQPLHDQGQSELALTLRAIRQRSEEHTSELQSRPHLVCRLLLEKKK